MGNLLTDLGAERLASQLAPFLMGHVGEHFALMPGGGLMIITSSYNDFTCTKYVEGLGDSVLENAERFFTEAAEKGEIGSLDLTQLVGVGRPSNLPFVLTTPLKKRTKALGLGTDVPWTPGNSADDRTIWGDRGWHRRPHDQGDPAGEGSCAARNRQTSPSDRKREALRGLSLVLERPLTPRGRCPDPGGVSRGEKERRMVARP